LQKIKVQQSQLKALLLGQKQQQAALESGKVEQSEKTVTKPKTILQNEPPQQSKLQLTKLLFDRLQLQNMISEVRFRKLLHKAMKKNLHMKTNPKKKAQKEGKKKQNKEKGTLEVA